MIWLLIPAVLLVGAFGGVALAWRFPLPTPFEAALEAERAENQRLTELLMAVQAPQPYAAYMDTTPPPPQRTYLFSEDGLSSIELDPEDL